MTNYEKWKKVQKLLWEGDDCMCQSTLFQLQNLVQNFTRDAAIKEHKEDDLVNNFGFLYKIS